MLESSIDEAVETHNLIFEVQHAQVILKRIWDVSCSISEREKGKIAPVLQPDEGKTLDSIPNFRTTAHGLVHQLVEVLIVAIDDVAAHVEEKAFRCYFRASEASWC